MYVGMDRLRLTGHSLVMLVVVVMLRLVGGCMLLPRADCGVRMVMTASLVVGVMMAVREEEMIGVNATTDPAHAHAACCVSPFSAPLPTLPPNSVPPFLPSAFSDCRCWLLWRLCWLSLSFAFSVAFALLS